MRLFLIAFALFSVLATVKCSHAWNPDLGGKDLPEWPDVDRVAFLRESPWAAAASNAVVKWGSDTRAELEVTAQFLTPFFVEQRAALKEIARTRDWMEVQPMLTFDEAVSVNTFFGSGQILMKGNPRYPLDHKILFPSRKLPGKIGLFPSGPDWLDFFHDQLQLERPRLNPVAMLEDKLDFENHYYVDMYFMPLIKSHRVGARVVNPVRCLNCVVGGVLLDGVAMRREDGAEIKPLEVVVLWHDIDEAWRKAVWRRGKSTAMGIPAAARLVFTRKDEAGLWLEKTRKVSLEMELPDGRCQSYSGDQSGMVWKSRVEFDLENMASAEKRAEKSASASVEPHK